MTFNLYSYKSFRFIVRNFGYFFKLMLIFFVIIIYKMRGIYRLWQKNNHINKNQNFLHIYYLFKHNLEKINIYSTVPSL
jgi:hypothetical protein